MHESLADEVVLWRLARTGDGSARERLGALAHEIASRELAFRGAPARDRSDLAQEAVRSTLAFLSAAAEAPKDLRAFLKFRAWGILSDHRKKMRANLAQLESDDGLEIASGDPAPQRTLERHQLGHALDDCRSRLADEQRTVLAMRYEQRLETEAIASELGVQRNTINVRVFRALASLRECMARKGFDAGDLP